MSALGGHALIARAFLWRGARLWLVSRTIASLVLRLAGANPLDLPAGTVIGIVALATALGWADVMRRHERALLGNLGLHASQYLAFIAVPAAVGEALLALAWRLVR